MLMEPRLQNITLCSVQEISEIVEVNLIEQKLFLVVGSRYMNISIYQDSSSF